jgi:hypothetical protein
VCVCVYFMISYGTSNEPLLGNIDPTCPYVTCTVFLVVTLCNGSTQVQASHPRRPESVCSTPLEPQILLSSLDAKRVHSHSGSSIEGF